MAGASAWWWCLHCEKCFESSDEYPTKCGTPGCDGHIGDFWTWEELRKSHPDYPVVPVVNEFYWLY